MSKQPKSDSSEKLIMGLSKKARSRVYTAIFVVAAIIFFIVNNSEKVPERGPYPPNYTPTNTSSLQPAAMFSLPGVDGKVVSLSDYSGKIVVVDFWATWCGPCRRSIPDLIELKKTYPNEIEIIGISVDTDSKNDVAPFMKEMGINYPVVFGNTNLYQSYGGIRSIPTAFIINHEGKIFKKYVGYVPLANYVSDIKQLLEKS